MKDVERKFTNIIAKVEELADSLANIYGTDLGQIKEWQKVLTTVKDYMGQDIIRIAVAGTVKSGKSTFINALLGRDYLKRGAGIITAFVTKIRHGHEAQAQIDFKTWDEINHELNEALTFFPVFDRGESPFNIRNDKDRKLLQEGLKALKSDEIFSQESIEKNFILLNSYLKGYERLSSYIGNTPSSVVFKGEQLAKHKEFVSQQSQAVFLRDILLNVPLGWIGEGVEIGDCQGIDSPNPLHFTLLQEYLLKSHLILYLISSRMGLREADIHLLSVIKTFRLLENTVFIINVDFSEHERLPDLKALIERVRQELSMVKPQPEIYAFSCLYNLLCRIREGDYTLGKKDLLRIQAWEEDQDMVNLSQSETQSLQEALTKYTTEKKLALLFSSGLELITTVTQGIEEFIKINQGLWDKDWATIKQASADIDEKRKVLDSVMATIKNTVRGSCEDIKKGVRNQVDSYFDRKYGPIIEEALESIKNYLVDLSQYKLSWPGELHPANASALFHVRQEIKSLTVLYQFYHGFRQSLCKFLTEEINLKIIDFVKTQEENIEKDFAHIRQPFLSMLEDSLQGYYGEVQKLGIASRVPSLATGDFMYRNPALNIPTFSRLMEYNPRFKARILWYFGTNKLTKPLKSIMKREDHAKKRETYLKFIKNGLKIVKSETKKELIEMLTEYKEGIKFGYFFKLIDDIADSMVGDLRTRINAVVVDLTKLVERVEQEKTKREYTATNLATLNQHVQVLKENIQNLKAGYPSVSKAP